MVGHAGAFSICVFLLGFGTPGSLLDALSPDELNACIGQFPECLQLLDLPGDEEEEQVAHQLLKAWLGHVSAQDAEAPAGLRKEALERVLALSTLSTQHPSMALGLGQALHSYFWWGAAGFGMHRLSVEVVYTALHLHELSLRHAGCNVSETPLVNFLRRKCPWRWRFVMLLGAELGLHLATDVQDFSAAAQLLKRSASNFVSLKNLPFFQTLNAEVGPLAVNQNWDYFPDARHRPVLPREAWPSFATFLEDNYETIRESLDGLLASASTNSLFEDAARFQSGLTPRHLDWSRLKVIHSGGQSDLCDLPFMQKTCKLLASRPEIGPQCGTHLSGASFARLLPGAELKPHFGTHPRLTVHLGLRVPVGASLTVAGREVLWGEGHAVVFDDTYPHKVRNRGQGTRYVLVAWFCHPCDLGWREERSETWQSTNPLPLWCGSGGGGYKTPPAPGYGNEL